VQSEPFDVLESFPDALPRKPIQSPNQDQIELALSRVRHHRAKLCAVCFDAGFLILIFGYDEPLLRRAEILKLV
jgi:hypothetical protein